MQPYLGARVLLADRKGLRRSGYVPLAKADVCDTKGGREQGNSGAAARRVKAAACRRTP